jgi:hypothetical protein
MGVIGAFGKAGIAICVALVLLISSPGTALLQADAPVGTPSSTDDLSHVGLLGTNGDPSSIIEGWDETTLVEQFEAWLTWSQHAPLEDLVAKARHLAPQSGAAILPAPDAYPDHERAPESMQRDAWRSWWIATHVAAMRSPSVPLDPLAGSMQAPADPWQSPGFSYDDHEGQTESEPERNPFGDPHSLDRLWRLQIHGPPRLLLPAGAGEEVYLVTDRGVLFLPQPGAAPDWMLHLEGIAGHAEVVEGDGRHDLVVGMHSLYIDDTTPSIWVVDGEEEKIRYSGLTGQRALLYWGLTDVDGDGKKDILGVDRSGNVTALKLDGTQIYRNPLPVPEELPTSSDIPDLPEGLDDFLMLAFTRTGMQALGDATGDGTLDIYATSTYGALGFQNLAVITLIEGRSGEMVWSQPLEPAVGSFFRFTVPTVTGDLTGDGLADVNVVDQHLGFLWGNVNLYLQAETGTILARDDHGFFSFGFFNEINNTPYVPLAFLDLEGDGTKKIVSLRTSWGFTTINGQWTPMYQPVLDIRTILPAPGSPTIIEETLRFEIADWYMLANEIQHSRISVNGKDTLLLLIPAHLTPPGHHGYVITVDSSGISMKEPPQPIGQYAVNEQTGQRYAWILNSDRYALVGDDIRPLGNGTRLIMSGQPILMHDADGDGTPDMLIRRSMGYFWISGQTGRILDTIDRPMSALFARSSMQEDGHVLETDPDHFILYNVIEREVTATISRSVADGARVQALADFTGDGRTELLLHKFGRSYVTCDESGCQSVNDDDEWIVYSPQEPGIVWQVTTDYAQGYVGEAIRDRDAMELLLVEHGDSTKINLYAPGAETPLVWSHSFDYAQLPMISNGLVLVYDRGDGDLIFVLEGASGQIVHQQPIEEGDLSWMRIVESRTGTQYLVYSLLEGPMEARKQSAVVVDLTQGTIISSFPLADPITIEQTYEFIGGSITYHWVIPNRPGPSVGEWDRDRVPELAFTEQGWPVVRSLASGEVLAVGPTKGTFTFSTDLNNDGRNEVALNTGGSLRLYAYDPSGSRLDKEDPMARAEIDDPDDEENVTVHRIFEEDKKRSPGPAVLLVPLVLAVAVALSRRNRRA